jgi:predicted transcriptional regulator
MKIQPTKELFEEMRAVARGEIAAPADAAKPSVESAEVRLQLLTPDNRGLLHAISDTDRWEALNELARLGQDIGVGYEK